MKQSTKRIILVLAIFLTTLTLPSFSFATTKVEYSDPIVVNQIFEKAQANSSWKSALLTGKQAQIVFMSVSPSTNPKNEIGMETHPFDQVILVAEGVGKASLGGKMWAINTGDMIFIPLGVAHNIINSDQKKPLKIISFYSATDIPAKAEYKTKADAPN